MMAKSPIFLIKLGLQQFLLVLIFEDMDLYPVDGGGSGVIENAAIMPA
jgi:hypothetical protein